jgi:hypothetical protein
MPILSGPKQDCAAALATEKIQEDTRRHDADALELLDRQKIWIAGHDQRRAAFNCRGKVLVIVGARPRPPAVEESRRQRETASTVLPE